MFRVGRVGSPMILPDIVEHVNLLREAQLNAAGDLDSNSSRGAIGPTIWERHGEMALSSECSTAVFSARRITPGKHLFRASC